MEPQSSSSTSATPTIAATRGRGGARGGRRGGAAAKPAASLSATATAFVPGGSDSSSDASSAAPAARGGRGGRRPVAAVRPGSAAALALATTGVPAATTTTAPVATATTAPAKAAAKKQQTAPAKSAAAAATATATAAPTPAGRGGANPKRGSGAFGGRGGRGGGIGRGGMSLLEQRSMAANADNHGTPSDSDTDSVVANPTGIAAGETKSAAKKKGKKGGNSIWDSSTSDDDFPAPTASPAVSARGGRGGSQQVGGKGVPISARGSAPTAASSSSSSSSSSGRGRGRVTAARRAAIAAGMYTSTESDTDGDENDQRERSTMLAKSIIEQLLSDTYDCSICSTKIGRRGRIWNCGRCHIILHSTCLDSWYRTKVSAAGPDGIASLSWPCPGCMYINTAAPKSYTCFCGKVANPDYNAYVTPHSCGGTCGKNRGPGCTHPCTMPCHPGFCPPCPAVGPMVTCPCTKSSYRLRCGEVERERKLCGAVCGRDLSCGTHKCSKPCHLGPCQPCDVKITQTCHCAKLTEPRVCGTGEGDSFSCTAICARDLSCGNHRCTQVCHPGDCIDCKRVPSLPQSCACGKNQRPPSATASAAETKQLAGASAPSKWLRKSCNDPMPICGDICGKLLNCGVHQCSMRCHDSPCLPCKSVAAQSCRCGKTTLRMPCAQYTALKRLSPGREWLCDKSCNKKMTCGRHKCTQKCCIADVLAGAVAAEPHVCERQCTQPLDCGVHRCDKFCHLGYCAPCNVVYRDGITCTCGKTRTPGPVKCGTAIPSCREQCSKPRTCIHKCAYNCHPGNCPPCAVLMKKRCAGGHVELSNIPCHGAIPSCGTPCKKPLSCGQHICQKLCHGGPCETNAVLDPVVGHESKAIRGGDVDDDDEETKGESKDAAAESDDRSCGQRCGEPRRECSHTCREPCHPDYECPDVACGEPILVYCECKRQSKKVACGLGDPTRKHVNRATLACDDTCAIETRNRSFRDAFGIKNDDERIQYASAFLDQIFLLDLLSFVPKVEKYLADFIGARAERTKNLPPMTQPQRWLTHQLAVYYGLDTESYDSEPRRTVRLLKSDRTGHYQPKMLLSQALKLYRPPSAAPPPGFAKKAPIVTTAPTTTAATSAPAAAAVAASSKAVQTVDPQTIINFYSYDKETRIFPSDLRTWFAAWEGKYRLNSISGHHLIAIFTDVATTNAVRADLEAKGLARTGSSSRPAASPNAAATAAAAAVTTSAPAAAGDATDSKTVATDAPAAPTTAAATPAAPITAGVSGWIMHRIPTTPASTKEVSAPAVHHKKTLAKDGEWTTLTLTSRTPPPASSPTSAAATVASTTNDSATSEPATSEASAPAAASSSLKSGTTGAWVPSWKSRAVTDSDDGHEGDAKTWRPNAPGGVGSRVTKDAWADQTDAPAVAPLSRSAKTPLTWDEMSANAAAAAAAAAASVPSRRRAPKGGVASTDGVPHIPFIAHGAVTQSANPFAGLDDDEDDEAEENDEENDDEEESVKDVEGDE